MTLSLTGLTIGSRSPGPRRAGRAPAPAMSGERVPISAEVRGRYRLWRTEARRRADCIETIFYSPLVSRAAGDFVRCTKSGHERAFSRLGLLLRDAGARFVDREEARQARWAYLRPTDEGWVQAL
jgi:hypothetical protein